MTWLTDALANHGWESNVITFSFDDSWSELEKAVFRTAIDTYTTFLDVSFLEVESDGMMVEHLVTKAQLDAVLGTSAYNAWHDEPGPESDGYYVQEDIYWTQLQPGGHGWWILLHEIGHGLGLEHPHSTWHGSGLFPGVRDGRSADPGDFGLNAVGYTVMSYNHGLGQGYASGGVATPMAFDIAVLQSIYGANTTYANGDNTYQLGLDVWSSIWDTGGTDEMRGTEGNDVIDLRAATLNVEAGGGGFFSRAGIGGFTIANGVVIENATGGEGDDTLRGNSAVNVLDGGNGNDTYIFSPEDIFYDASGWDAFVSAEYATTLQDGIEELRMSGDAYLGIGTDEDNALYGTAGNNRLQGLGGDDWLHGGRGNDYLTGGDGADVFAYSHRNQSKRDVITDYSAEDHFDFRAMDARAGVAGNQAFKWINKQEFHGIAGELRYEARDAFALIEGDVNGDGVADFSIRVLGVASLNIGDFVL